MTPHRLGEPTLNEMNFPTGGVTGPALCQQARVPSVFTPHAILVPMLMEVKVPWGGSSLSPGLAAQQASVPSVLIAQAAAVAVAYPLLTLTEVKVPTGGVGGVVTPTDDGAIGSYPTRKVGADAYRGEGTCWGGIVRIEVSAPASDGLVGFYAAAGVVVAAHADGSEQARRIAAPA